MIRLVLISLMLAGPVRAESLIATRVIRAQTVLSASDMTLVAAEIDGALSDPAEALGLEARVTLYPGRAIRGSDIGPPAMVERNQLVTLIYRAGGLGITTEGRALARGGTGDVIRVMNLASRMTVAGRVAADGSVQVGP